LTEDEKAEAFGEREARTWKESKQVVLHFCHYSSPLNVASILLLQSYGFSAGAVLKKVLQLCGILLFYNPWGNKRYIIIGGAVNSMETGPHIEV
jgi:hypothetical protein